MGKCKDINFVFEFLEKRINDPLFLSGRYAGAEIPNYICSYPPEENQDYEIMIEKFANKLRIGNVHALHLNLYDIMIDLLEKTGDLEAYLEESSLTKDEIKEDFSGILDMETEFAPAVAQRINNEKPQLVLISGIGEVYPFLRVHTLLEKLSSLLSKIIPVVVFFPGEYGHIAGTTSFKLFGRLNPINYYRAFNIFNEE